MHVSKAHNIALLFNYSVLSGIFREELQTKATRFRIWATHVLKDHIVKGYTVNEQRFREQAEKLVEMQKSVELLARTLTAPPVSNETHCKYRKT